jgi:type VI secretion system protein ImpA
MAPAIQHDIEKLLSPISAERPAGESLRYDGTYEKIRAARREDDATLPQGVWKTELRKAQWQVVESLCVEALETKSKDVQIAAWLTEARLNLYSFQGAASGIELMRALCETFWEELYPAIENNDLEFRLAPVSWVNEKLSISLKLRAITEPDGEAERAYCWSDWESASRIDNLMHRPDAPKTIPDGAITTAKFQKSVILTPTAWFRTLWRDVRRLIESCARLEEIVDAKAGAASPGLLRFTAVAEAIERFLDSVLQQRSEPEEDFRDIGPSADTSPEEQAGAAMLLPVPGGIRDRADAYHLLAAAADFLARTEPHSPTPYLIRRAIAWGDMNFDELLPELVRNTTELAEIFRLLQIRKSPPTG